MSDTPPNTHRSWPGRDLLDASHPLARILDLADDAIISINQQQVIILFNQGAEKLFGYTRESIIGQPLDILLPPRLAGLHRHHVAAFGQSRVAARQMGERSEILGQRWDGSEFPAAASISKVEFDGDTMITVILRDVTGRKLAEEQLRASLREKEVLLQEIHHRVKNNLQTISSLLGLQARSAGDAAIRKQFEETQRRIQSMALLHQELYQPDHVARIDLAHYIRRLAKLLIHSHGLSSQIGLDLKLESLYFPMDVAMPFGLIVHELLSNAFKYAFPENRTGVVRVELHREPPGGAVRLRVADNGVGLPEGVDWVAATSLGLRLVRSLAGQLDGVVEMNNAGGTDCILTFPSPPDTE
jgi:PAS domain S-box-containing protein